MHLVSECHSVADAPSIPPHRITQEFLVDYDVEVRASSSLSRSEFVAILEKMFKGCTEPPEPPTVLTEEFKRQREKAALVRMDIYEHAALQRFQPAAKKDGCDTQANTE